MNPSLTEKKLILDSLNGNHESFKELIEIHRLKLKSSMFNCFNNLTNEDFEDCWQNAIIKAFLNLKKFREDSSFKTWLYTILRNEILLFLKWKQNIDKFEIKIDYLLKNEDDKNLEYTLKSQIDQHFSETAFSILEKKEEVSEFKKLINNSLEKLQPSQAEILNLILVEEKSYKEVSDLLKIPIGTVMSRLFFAKKNVKKIIKENARIENIQLPIY